MTDDFFKTEDIRLNREQAGSHWGNFGYWQTATKFPEACKALAELHGDMLELSDKDRLLDLGFGCGDQIKLWREQYRVPFIAGINLSSKQTSVAQNKTVSLSGVELLCDDAMHTEKLAQQHGWHINKIVALDCLYHFPDKIAVLAQCARLLPAGGKIVVTDFIRPSGKTGLLRRLILKQLLGTARCPYRQIISKADCGEQLQAFGLTARFIPITEDVLGGFTNWLPGYISQQPEKKPLYWRKYRAVAAMIRWVLRYRLLEYHLLVMEKRG